MRKVNGPGYVRLSLIRNIKYGIFRLVKKNSLIFKTNNYLLLAIFFVYLDKFYFIDTKLQDYSHF